jgi:hypothetical protein
MERGVYHRLMARIMMNLWIITSVLRITCIIERPMVNADFKFDERESKYVKFVRHDPKIKNERKKRRRKALSGI